MLQKKCKTEGCKKKAPKNRGICRSCRTVREREANPVRYAFMNHRKNARARGIPHTITLEEFTEHVISTGYMAGKGRFKNSLHIDRRDESKGYVSGNLATITNSENVRKSLQYRYDMRHGKMEFKMLTHKVNTGPDPDVPF